MRKPTPGPWTSEFNPSGQSATVYAPDPSDYANAGELYVIADSITPADASLIAAAPDLLEALKSFQHGGDFEPDDQAVRFAVSVIAKAEGR